MEITLNEAAKILGRPARTLRDQVSRGAIPGSKIGGKWVLHSDKLPLTERQRRAVQARAEEIRASVEEVLPSRAATSRAQGRRSLADLEPFRKGSSVLREMREAGERWNPAAAELEAGLLALAESNAWYDRDAKVAGIRAARACVGRSVARLLMDGDAPLAEPVPGWLETLEREVLPLLAGLSRWAERLPGGKR